MIGVVLDTTGLAVVLNVLFTGYEMACWALRKSS